MTYDKSGGPAFPCAADDFNDPWEGMKLRDWFAGQALAAMEDRSLTCDTLHLEARAMHAYAMADAMIKQRKMPVDTGET